MKKELEIYKVSQSCDSNKEALLEVFADKKLNAISTFKKTTIRKIPIIEQETIITIDRWSDTAVFYSSDSRYINKISKCSYFVPAEITFNPALKKVLVVTGSVPLSSITLRKTSNNENKDSVRIQ
jgi:hypothetical protein